MPNIHAIIVAAGSGSRFGGAVHKQFLQIAGMPVAMRAVEGLRTAFPEITDTIVLSDTDINIWESLCVQHGFRSPDIALGGKSRFESVLNSLVSVPYDTDLIIVHDGARPFVSVEVAKGLMAALDDPRTDGAIPVLPLTDSIRRLLPDRRSQTVDRSDYVTVQTPQIFRAELLIEAYRKATSVDGFTDDASVMERAGFKNIALIEGNPDNIKITYPRDLIIAENLIIR